MESPSLGSVRAKIGRAQVHLDAISAALNLTLSTKPEVDDVGIDADLKGQQLICKIRKVDPIDPALPLMIGDCIHNLRSALDHLVHRLALLNGAASKSVEKTFFPIYLTPSEFDERVKKLLKPFVSDSAFAEIKKSQPYTAYDVPKEADIWILHKLDIIDKHRLLLVARDQFAVGGFTFSYGGLSPFQQVIPEPKWKPMEDGAEMIRFHVSGGPPGEVKVNMKIEATRTVQLVDTGLACDGMPIVSVLNQLMAITVVTVRDFGRKFFGE